MSQGENHMRVDSSVNMASNVRTMDQNTEINVKEIHQVEGNNQNGNEAENNFSEKLIKKAMEKANKDLEGVNRRVEREVHEKTKAVIFRIRDTRTNEVIKEFPPEKIQDMIAKMWELAGLFVDERA